MIALGIKRISTTVAVSCVVALASACAIQLRDESDQIKASAQATQEFDPLAAKLAQCRGVTYEQKDALAECRKVWAEKRRRFLGARDTAPPHPDTDEALTARRGGDSRLPDYRVAPEKE